MKGDNIPFCGVVAAMNISEKENIVHKDNINTLNTVLTMHN